MAQKRIAKDIEKKITLFAKKIEQEGTKINSLVLFGSRAKGRAKSYSDIDLAIVSESFGKDEIATGARLRILANNIDWRIEPHPLTLQDFKEKSNPFVHEILSSGIKII